MTKMMRVESLALSLWVGCMVGVGYVAAPVLFKTLDDRSLAGSLAGQMFEIVGIAGLLIGLFLIASLSLAQKSDALREWRFWLLVAMVTIVVASQFIVQPMMADLKAMGLTPGSDAASRFGMMHGVSSLMYMATTISGAVLIVMGLRSGRIRLRASDIQSFE